MLRKEERTVDRYMKAGASVRLARAVIARMVEDIGGLVPAFEQERMMRTINRLEDVFSKAEDNMFRDHPRLSNEYLDVFYGSIGLAPRSDVDSIVMELAREEIDGLLTRKGC